MSEERKQEPDVLAEIDAMRSAWASVSQLSHDARICVLDYLIRRASETALAPPSKGNDDGE